MLFSGVLGGFFVFISLSSPQESKSRNFGAFLLQSVSAWAVGSVASDAWEEVE